MARQQLFDYSLTLFAVQVKLQRRVHSSATNVVAHVIRVTLPVKEVQLHSIRGRDR